MKPKNFSRNVLVLSSSKGIGYGISKNLLNNNYNVSISSSNKKNLKNSQIKLKQQTGSKPFAVKLDLRNNYSLKINLKKIIQIFDNRIDILILNSPGPKVVQIKNLTEKLISEAVNQNVLNLIYIIKKILPLMIKNKFGRIINLSSTVAKEPSQNMVLSSLTRSAMLAFCKNLAIEYGKYNITTNSILAGGVLTSRLKKLFKKSEIENIKKKLPVRFIATPDEFSHIINFLCSDYSSYINGISIPVDGGLSKFI